MVKKILLKET